MTEKEKLEYLVEHDGYCFDAPFLCSQCPYETECNNRMSTSGALEFAKERLAEIAVEEIVNSEPFRNVLTEESIVIDPSKMVCMVNGVPYSEEFVHDAKCWKLLMEKLDYKCQYSGTKSMLLPVLTLIEEVKKEVGE
jgi:hypothetical protein